MAKVTVEDAIKKVNNRFELILLTSHRVRELNLRPDVAVEEPKSNKHTVLALKEISTGSLPIEGVKDTFINNLQHGIINNNTATVSAVNTDNADDLDENKFLEYLQKDVSFREIPNHGFSELGDDDKDFVDIDMNSDDEEGDSEE